MEGVTPVGLIEDTNGTLYGMTDSGGPGNDSVVYSLSLGLGQFINPQPPAGEVGSPVSILGTDLTSATSVTFNGTPATFTVVSPTEIATQVPSGATTGKIEVVTPTATLFSNLTPFRVAPVITGFTPTSGAPGTQIIISGSGFLKTSAVTFFLKAAAGFTINSDTQITAMVPSNATAGAIQVTTSGGTVTSTQRFTVE
jgi:hypothetical protein